MHCKTGPLSGPVFIFGAVMRPQLLAYVAKLAFAIP